MEAVDVEKLPKTGTVVIERQVVYDDNRVFLIRVNGILFRKKEIWEFLEFYESEGAKLISHSSMYVPRPHGVPREKWLWVYRF